MDKFKGAHLPINLKKRRNILRKIKKHKKYAKLLKEKKLRLNKSIEEVKPRASDYKGILQKDSVQFNKHNEYDSYKNAYDLKLKSNTISSFFPIIVESMPYNNKIPIELDDDSCNSCESDISVPNILSDNKLQELNKSSIIFNDLDLQNKSKETICSESADSDFLLNNEFAQFHTYNNFCIVVIKYPGKLYFNGKIQITPIFGKVEILGYMPSQSVVAFSPKGTSFLCIETIKDNTNQTSKDKTNVSEYAHIQFLNNIQCDECFAVVKLEGYEDRTTKFIESHGFSQMYPKINQVSLYSDYEKAEKQLQCKFFFNDENINCFHKNLAWNDIIESLDSHTDIFHSTIVCGGKNVGKTTFLRYCINKFLLRNETVLCIDLDPGQSELFIPSCITASIIETPILGPNFTQHKKIKRSVFIGEIDVKLCIKRYLKAVETIVSYCQNDDKLKNMPWIVNTMGFTQGLGLEIIVSVINIIKPTNLVQIISKRNSHNFSKLLYPNFVNTYGKTKTSIDVPLEYSFHIMNSLAETKYNGGWKLEPWQIRELSILAYLSQMMIKGTEHITDIKPYVCSLKSIKIAHVNSIESLPNMASIINAKLVALCEQQLKDDIWNCLGFGIVRGFDMQSEEIYLLTPLEEDILQRINCLVLGNISLPSSTYITSVSKYAPYVTSFEKQHTTKIPKRSLYNPKNFLKTLR